MSNGLFSGSRGAAGGAFPPPTGGGDLRKAGAPDPSPAPVFNVPDFDSEATARPKGHKFDAELDVCELDERDRPGSTWTAKGKELSRSAMAIRSRRMCYIGRHLLMAVHLIDARPVAIYGRVTRCDYDADGMYLVELDLLPRPDNAMIRAWLEKS